MPRCGRLRLGTRVISRSNSSTAPASGVSSPVMRLNSVVLPAPFGPMIRRRSPGSTARLTLAVTRSPPNDWWRFLPAGGVWAWARGGPGRSGSGFGPIGAAPSDTDKTHGARHQAFGYEHHDGDEDGAEHEIPARDVGAHHVLDDNH